MRDHALARIATVLAVVSSSSAPVAGDVVRRTRRARDPAVRAQGPRLHRFDEPRQIRRLGIGQLRPAADPDLGAPGSRRLDEDVVDGVVAAVVRDTPASSSGKTMSSISSVRFPRSDLWTPTASYSASFQPTPAPGSSGSRTGTGAWRSSLASRTGLRSSMIRIDVPRRTRSVTPAATARADRARGRRPSRTGCAASRWSVMESVSQSRASTCRAKASRMPRDAAPAVALRENEGRKTRACPISGFAHGVSPSCVDVDVIGRDIRDRAPQTSRPPRDVSSVAKASGPRPSSSAASP